MTSAGAGHAGLGIEQLTRDHPEWSPWLALIGAAIERADDPTWGDIRVAPAASGAAGAPLLTGAVISIDGRVLDRWVADLLALAGQNEEMSQSFASLRFALLLAVLLVYLVMASQFESLLHPFIIMFTLPMAVIGVVLTLILTHTPISVMVLIGMIILAGIVVSNGIVLVSYTNQLRHLGRSKREALVEAGLVRMRPILLTALATILGLLPMSLGIGEGAEIRAPLALTLIGGLACATALTLIVLPVMYAALDRRP